MVIAAAAHHKLIADQIELCNCFIILKIGSDGEIIGEDAYFERRFDINELIKFFLFHNVKALLVNKIEESTSESLKSNNIKVIEACTGDIKDVVKKIIEVEVIPEFELELASEKKVNYVFNSMR